MLLSVVLALIDEVGIWAIVRFTPSEDPFVANRMEGTCGYSANPEKLLQRVEAPEKNWRPLSELILPAYPQRGIRRLMRTL